MGWLRLYLGSPPRQDRCAGPARISPIHIIEPPMIRASVLSLLLVATRPIGADAQIADSAQEAIYQKYWTFPTLVRGGAAEPVWLPDGKSFWYADGAPDSTVIYQVDPARNTKTPLFDIAR